MNHEGGKAMGWICDGIPKDGKDYSNGGPHSPCDNPPTATHCFKCELPKEAVVITTSKGHGSSSGTGAIVLGMILLGLTGLIGYLIYRSVRPEPVIVAPSPLETPLTSIRSDSDSILDDRSSSGDRSLFRDSSASNLSNGIERFAREDYDGAVDSFQEAVEAAPNQPEPEIYLNNAVARCQNTAPYVVATVVPITNNPDQAKEILRGVADAQRQFNGLNNTENKSRTWQCDSNDRLLEIKIVDDANDPEIANQVSQALAGDPKVLAVIGHNSSDASKSAIVNYGSAGLAMISPTSSSTQLKGDTFFRTLPSDEKSGAKLAKYLNENINKKNVSVFYTSTSPYSVSLRQAFENNYQGNTRSFDFAEESFNSEDALQKLKDNNLDVVVLFPSVKQRDKVIALANVAKDKKDQNLELTFFGGDALYAPETLRGAGSALKGMILAVPWFREGDYATRASDRWQGQISWRTAMAYDAAQAIVNTIEQNTSTSEITREDIVENLRTLRLDSSQTSGTSLSFDNNGDRNLEPVLVEIVFGGQNRPEASEYSFYLVE